MSEVTVSDRIWTIPNILSMLRLAMVPVFLWLVLGPEEDLLAVILLAVSAVTDWLDGQIARKFNQTSRLGQLLDPIADRAFIICTLLGLLLRGIVPWWLVAIVVARDLFLGLSVLPPLQRQGITGLPVHFLGKAATAFLLYSFPLLFLGDGEGTVADVCRVLGWAGALWGTALYWYGATVYRRQATQVLDAVRQGPSGPAAATA